MITVRQSVHLRDAGIIVVAVHPGFLKTDMGGERAPPCRPTRVLGA